MLEQIAEKMKALKGVITTVEKQFGKGAIMALGDEGLLEPVPTIPTGSLALDLATGVGGYPRGRVIEVYGPESSGKTTLALHAISQAQRCGGVCAFVDAEHAFDMICAKGIEQATGKLMTEVLAEELPSCRVAVLSGPGFAADVVRGLPTALTLACTDETLGKALAEAIGYRHFRLYWSDDITGVALGGALKNVLAIAAGIVEGRGLGASAHAALVTRGFAELRRLGAALGADPETLVGLSGLGDLLLTCGSPQSRNMRLGRALGQGHGLADALTHLHSTAEGVYTAASAVRQAAAHGVDVPIVAAVHAIIEGKLTIDAAIEALLSRPFRSEV